MSGFPVFVGCAGWSIPRQHAGYFPAEGSHLERYARFLPAVEINSSFYRPHKPATYARWAASVPDGFRFAVKVPKAITHERRLTDCADLLDRFLGEVRRTGRPARPPAGPASPQLPLPAQTHRGVPGPAPRPLRRQRRVGAAPSKLVPGPRPGRDAGRFPTSPVSPPTPAASRREAGAA